MTLIVDAGVLFAQADAEDPEHEVIAALLSQERGPMITSQIAVAEADYLILERLASTSSSPSWTTWRQEPSSSTASAERN